MPEPLNGIAGYRYHRETPICSGCKKDFIDTITYEGANEGSYCANCYGSVAGLDEYAEMVKNLSEIDMFLLSTPVDQVPKELIEKLVFVDKNYKKRLLS